MRVALIGATGQLGTALQGVLTDDVIPLGHREIEITEPASIHSALSAAGAECVINTAAYNLVDRAEDEPEVAYRVNALGPRHLAQWCARHEVRLVHVSTDYVFGLEDRSEPYRETDAPGPQSAYAISKLAGEYFVRAECPRHFVVRTCGLYGRAASAGKGNFVETMLRIGRERGAVRVVDDQHCTPTSAVDLAAAIARLIGTEAYGLYHASNAGGTTWCRLAREIFRLSDMSVDVTPISTAEFAAKARRPGYSVLNCERLTQATGFEMPRWEDALARYLAGRPA